jgi:hypothetical protein
VLDNWARAPFTSYSNNVYSQNGEDGILSEIFKRLEPSLSSVNDRTCVEFGAWDGVHLSNTFQFIENFGWKAILIEGDESRFTSLKQLAVNFPNITPVNQFVGRWTDKSDNLESILSDLALPCNFELLSIDIDSYDLDVWEGLTDFSPLVVVIEINSSFPPGILKRHDEYSSGNSFSSTLEVAIQKGYTLVAHTGNCIFVKNELVKHLGIPNRYAIYPELLFKSSWVRSVETQNPSDKIYSGKLLRVIKKLLSYLSLIKQQL